MGRRFRLPPPFIFAHFPALAVIGHLLLIPPFGPVGAAIVTTFCAGLGALASVLAVYRIWRIFPPLGTALRTLPIGGIAYALAAFWPVEGFMLLLKLPLIGIVILLAFFLLGEFSPGEIVLARSVVHGRALPERNPSEV